MGEQPLESDYEWPPVTSRDDYKRATALYPDPFRGPWEVMGHFAEVEGRVECVGLDIRSFKIERVEGGETYRRIGEEGPQVLSAERVRRELPIGRLVEACRQSLMMGTAWAGYHDEELAPDLARKARDISKQLAGSPRRRYEPEHFAAVADAYRRALWEGDKAPTKAVAEHFKARHTTAAKWVQVARQMGLLEPTQRRRAGGL